MVERTNSVVTATSLRRNQNRRGEPIAAAILASATLLVVWPQIMWAAEVSAAASSAAEQVSGKYAGEW